MVTKEAVGTITVSSRRHPERRCTWGGAAWLGGLARCLSCTDLDLLLRIHAIKEIVLLGGATNLVVEGTARQAADRGPRVTVLADVCAAFTAEAHEIALASMAGFVRLLTTSERIGELQA